MTRLSAGLLLMLISGVCWGNPANHPGVTGGSYEVIRCSLKASDIVYDAKGSVSREYIACLQQQGFVQLPYTEEAERAFLEAWSSAKAKTMSTPRAHAFTRDTSVGPEDVIVVAQKPGATWQTAVVIKNPTAEQMRFFYEGCAH